jgi:hypothetical protein
MASQLPPQHIIVDGVTQSVDVNVKNPFLPPIFAAGKSVQLVPSITSGGHNIADVVADWVKFDDGTWVHPATGLAWKSS